MKLALLILLSPFAGQLLATPPHPETPQAAPHFYVQKESFSETLTATRDRFRSDTPQTAIAACLEELSNRIALDFPLANTVLLAYNDFDLKAFMLAQGEENAAYRALTGGATLQRLAASWLLTETTEPELAGWDGEVADSDSERLKAIEALARRLHAAALRRCPPVAYVRRKRYGMRGTNATMFSQLTDRGSALCIYDPAHPQAGETVIFATEEGFIFDIHPGFDGKTLMMSYKESQGEPFHIWEIGIDGSALRQITHGPWHDVTPLYYPDGRIVFSSSRSEAFSMCQNFLAFNLYACQPDGSDIRRFDFTTLCSVSPALAADGSILCSRWEYMDKTLFTWQGIWNINPNGRQLKLHYGNTLLIPQALYAPKQIPDTELVMFVMAGHHHIPVHDLALCNRSKGLENLQSARKLTNHRPAHQFKKGPWTLRFAGGDDHYEEAYSEPWPFCRELSVVSYGHNRTGRACAVLLDHGGITYPLFEDRSGGCFSVVTLNPRPPPPAIPGDCPQQPGIGSFYVHDIYQGLTEQGVERGQVKSLRIWRQVAKKYNTEGPRIYDHYPIIGAGTYYVKELCGEVPVEQNGSVYFTAPSNAEIYFQAVDARGREIQRMGSVTQITSGEQVACIGCHEQRQMAPPTDGKSEERLQSEPATPAGGMRIDYVKLVQPIWDRHCVSCHNGETLKGGIDLTGDKTRFTSMSYDALVIGNSANYGYLPNYRYVQAYFLGHGPSGVFPALKTGSMVSPLIAMLEQQHSKVQLSPTEFRSICIWIDANIPYYSTWEMTRPWSQGGRDIFTRPGPDGKPVRQAWAGSIETLFRDLLQCELKSADLNFSNPQLSKALRNNLARSGGGRAPDDKALFKTRADPGYQRLLAAVEAGRADLAECPRIDMPGAVAIPQERNFAQVFGYSAKQSRPPQRNAAAQPAP